MSLKDLIADAQQPTERDDTDDEIVDETGAVFLEDVRYFDVKTDADAARAVERILTHRERLERLTAQYEKRKAGLERQIEGYLHNYDPGLRAWLEKKIRGLKRRYEDVDTGRVAFKLLPGGIFLDADKGGKARLLAWALKNRPDLTEPVEPRPMQLRADALEVIKAELDRVASAEAARQEDPDVELDEDEIALLERYPTGQLPDGLRRRAPFDKLEIKAPKK